MAAEKRFQRQRNNALKNKNGRIPNEGLPFFGACIIGTKGTLQLAKGKGTLFARDGDEQASSMIEPDQHTATSCVEHFCRVLRGEEQLIATAEVGFRGLKIVEGIYAAAETNRRAALPTPLK